MQKKKKNSFWNNTKAKIIVATAFVAGAAAFFSNAGTIINFLKDVISHKKVELVSVSFSGNDSLDIKLRNTGEAVSILKTIVISIKNRWLLLPDDESKSFLVVDSRYDIEIDTSIRPGTVIEKAISEQLEPNKASRFLLHFGPLQKDLSCSYVYLADLTILCDEDNKKLEQKNLLFALIDHSGIYFKQGEAGSSPANLSAVQDIEHHPGIRSAAVISLIDMIKKR